MQGSCRTSAPGMINFREPSGNAALSLCEICRNQTEQTEILLSRRHKVNIHMRAVGVECKFSGDIRVDKKSESSPDGKGGGNYFVTQLSGNSDSKGRSRITDCINLRMERQPVKIGSNSSNRNVIK